MNINKEINNIMSQFESDLGDLIKIESVIDEAVHNAPFGIKIQKALEEMSKIASRLGFNTYLDPNGHYGYAEIGSGEELFGILGHLDVVSAGDISKWNTPPFELTITDTHYYGRGVNDDKGPILAAMYALKILLNQGYIPTKRIRFIFGGDEESLWRCMQAYAENEEMPQMGFSPDSTFPLIFAEKALVQIKLKTNEQIDFSLVGGQNFNTVASSAKTEVDQEVISILENENANFDYNHDSIIVHGVPVHAQICDQGVNAITVLSKALSKYNNQSSLLRFINDKCTNPNGLDIFGNIEDQESGKLMFNLGMANFSKTEQTLCIDLRIPVKSNHHKIVEKLKEICESYDLRFEVIDTLRPIYVDQESVLIKSLMQAYQSVTNDFESKPKASGGATYARAMDNCVAFGAVSPKTEKTAHQVNEMMPIEDIKSAIAIYMKAYQLLVLKENNNEEI